MAKKISVSQNKLEYSLLAIIFGLGFYLVSHNIGYWSFWFDESFTSSLIKYDYGEVVVRTINDVHPPLYYLLLKIWSDFFGASDAILRWFSGGLMLFAGFSLYRLLKVLSNKYFALISTLMIVVGPFFVRYSQEARMYALAAAIISVATIIIHKQINTKSKQRSRRLWVAYGGLLAAALYTHYFTFPIFAAHLLYVIYADTNLKLNFKITRKKILSELKKIDKNYIKANVFAVLLFSPWLPVFFKQTTRVSQDFWIDPVGYTSFTDTLSQMFLYENFSPDQSPAKIALGLSLTALIVAGLVALWRRLDRTEKANSILLFGPMAVAAVILFVYSLVPGFSSVYSVRYFAIFAVLLYASLGYLAYLIWKHVSKSMSSILAAMVLAIAFSATVQVGWGWGRDHFVANRGIAALNKVLNKNDAVVVSDYWHYYDTQHYLKQNFTPKIKPSGNFYGAASLIENRGDIIIDDFESDVYAPSGIIWYVSGADDDFSSLPWFWRPERYIFNERDLKITLMRIDKRIY